VSQTPAEKMAAHLAALWQKNQPVMLERMAVLERAAAAGAGLSPELRAEATAVAHKFAGTLGMFGRPEGTAIARELEVLLESGGTDKIAGLVTQLQVLLFPQN
jgi:HPt (histidine-containing phosphotransfer) domain-containing protein